MLVETITLLQFPFELVLTFMLLSRLSTRYGISKVDTWLDTFLVLCASSIIIALGYAICCVQIMDLLSTIPLKYPLLIGLSLVILSYVGIIGMTILVLFAYGCSYASSGIYAIVSSWQLSYALSVFLVFVAVFPTVCALVPVIVHTIISFVLNTASAIFIKPPTKKQCLHDATLTAHWSMAGMLTYLACTYQYVDLNNTYSFLALFSNGVEICISVLVWGTLAYVIGKFVGYYIRTLLNMILLSSLFSAIVLGFAVLREYVYIH